LDQKHIAVIDDDESVLETIASTLELERYRVETAKSSSQEIEKPSLDIYNPAIIETPWEGHLCVRMTRPDDERRRIGASNVWHNSISYGRSHGA
jgi:ActR/RegA family two-component response regulator